MKRLIAVLLWLGAGSTAFASPYFRPIDIAHPITVGGALFDLKNIGNTSATGLVPLVTHSPEDGCLLPSIVCEDWTPAAVGLSVNAGKVTFDYAPLVNILPWMSSAGLAITPSSWSGVRGVLKGSPGGSSVTFSGGPVWEYQQRTNKGYLKVFTGFALHF